MSSASPKRPKKPDLAIIGSGWEAWLAADLAEQRGLTVAVFEPSRRVGNSPEVVHIGNGEIFERACLALSDRLASALWNYSEKNLKLAADYLKSDPVPVVWHVSSPQQIDQAKKSVAKKNYYRWNDGRMEESGFSFFPGALIESVKNRLKISPISLNADETPKRVGVMEYEVQGLRVPLVLILSDEVLIQMESSLSEEIIPVTLSVFETEASAAVEKGYHLFNGGIDFAMKNPESFFMGSLRNLYADKAVGFHDKPDPVSQDNLIRFFLEKKWLTTQSVSGASLRYVSLSCDGLPVVGPLRSAGGVFFASGYSGRNANFAFAVLNDLLSDLVEGKGSRIPEFLSNRRFV